MMYSGGEIVETWKMWWICYREIFYSLLQEDYFVKGCDKYVTGRYFIVCYKKIILLKDVINMLQGDIL